MTKSQAAEVIPHEQQQPRQDVAIHQPTPLEIFAKAMDKGIDIEKMRELRTMVEWHESREAEKAFNAAMAAFRAEAITIIKNKTVGYDHKDGGGRTSYTHATLDAVLEAAVPKLSEHGLSHRWETTQEGGNITVTCIITHKQGHSYRTALSAGADNSGKKNSIQAIGSTISYLERYTFMAATGLAAKGQDDDGAGSDGEPQTISQAEVEQIDRLVRLTNTDLATLLEWAQVEQLEDLPAAKFKETFNLLQRKKRTQEKEAAEKK